MRQNSISPALAALQTVQEQQRQLLEPLSERDIRTQFHPALSPLGWHLGHCVATEAVWLSRCTGTTLPAARLGALYDPSRSNKPSRGQSLPDKATLLAWAGAQQQRHREILNARPEPACRSCKLTDLPSFLLQHHAQHLEIMQMALAQRTARQHLEPAAGAQLAAQPLRRETVLLPAGDYLLGSENGQVFDNEQPLRPARLRPAQLARWPVRNAEYLGFMEDGGYHQRRLWSAAGWRWRTTLAALQPEHWRQVTGGRWLLLLPQGLSALPAEGVLAGINYFEAQAFARWAGARLPHEYEWEAAATGGLLAGIGSAWEWCQNRFHPYPGFIAFPYTGYSLPWFDGRHYVLRGGSLYTALWVRRFSFRNFYQPETRHIFAGCRLAFDDCQPLQPPGRYVTETLREFGASSQ